MNKPSIYLLNSDIIKKNKKKPEFKVCKLTENYSTFTGSSSFPGTVNAGEQI